MYQTKLIILSVCLSSIITVTICQTYTEDDSTNNDFYTKTPELKKAVSDSLSNSSVSKTENRGLTKDPSEFPDINSLFSELDEENKVEDNTLPGKIETKLINVTSRDLPSPTPPMPELPDINSLLVEEEEVKAVTQSVSLSSDQATQSKIDHITTSHGGGFDLPNIDSIFGEDEDDNADSILTSLRPKSSLRDSIVTEKVTVYNNNQKQNQLTTDLPDLDSILKGSDFPIRDGENDNADSDKENGYLYTETVNMQDLDDEDKEIYTDPDDVVAEKAHEHVSEDFDDTKTLTPTKLEAKDSDEKEIPAEADSDDDEEYDISKWSKEKQEEDDDIKEEDNKQYEEVSEIHGHMMEDVVDEEMIKKAKPPTAPSGMVLLYTWLIVAILIIVVGISTYQARCKGFKIPFLTKSTPCNGEDKKRLLDHEFV